MSTVGTKCGIELPIAHETAILKTGIDFSSNTCALPLFPSVPLRNFHTGGIDSGVGISSMAELIPPDESMLRNRLPAAFDFLKYHLCSLAVHSAASPASW
jgi:hypothetical protein